MHVIIFPSGLMRRPPTPSSSCETFLSSRLHTIFQVYKLLSAASMGLLSVLPRFLSGSWGAFLETPYTTPRIPSSLPLFWAEARHTVAHDFSILF